VTELQRALNAAGAHLATDGAFGPRTEQAVRDFQRKANVAADGVVGPQTLRALETYRGGASGPSGPGPSSGSHSEFNTYAAMVRAAGGQVNPGGQVTILGIRPKNGGATTSYSDQFVALLPNGTVRHFTGSTRPGQTRSSESPDVNGDGVGDVAMLRPGSYYAVPNGLHDGKPSYSVRSAANHGSDNVAAYRDLNHDGFYSASEKDYALRHNITASSILFHVGQGNPSSIGCQNLMPSNIDSFINAVGGSGASFNYTLVER
jgi:hypothetical protein